MFVIERDFAGRQIPGARPYQEDAQGFASLEEDADGNTLSLLVILADGMGGENAGDVASRCVVEAFVDYCHRCKDRENTPAMLRRAMLAANEELDAAIVNDPGLDGMGSTLLATVISQETLYWISVGDSPLYLYRNGELSQINEDHSMMPILLEQVEAGYLEEEDLLTHPDRNVLQSAMMGGEIELVDCPDTSFPLLAGDVLIVASDGLQTLDEDEIKIRLDRHVQLPADAIALKLIKAVETANDPRQDNTSINVISIPDPAKRSLWDEDDESRSRTRVLRRSGKSSG